MIICFPRRPTPVRTMRRSAFVAAVAACLALLAPDRGAAQGIAVGPKVGTTGLGVDVILNLAPKLSLKGGAGFSLVDVDLDLGCNGGSCTTYRVEPPPILLTGSIDIRVAGPVRIMAGLLHRTENTRFGADLAGPVDVGDELFDGPGRIQGALVSATTAPFVGLGFGALGGDGMKVYLDVALAYAGDPDVTLVGLGPLAGEPGFDVELEKERLRILDDIDTWYQYWPVVNLGFRFRL